MNSDDLRVFVEIVQAQGISGAARSLGRPKSSVSRQLARLESEAGAALIERGPASMRLTEAGRVLFDHATQVVALIDIASASVQAALGTPRGVLRVNVPHLFAAGFMAARLPAFLRHHPGIELVLDVSPAPAGALARDADVMVRVGPLEDSALIARRLGRSALRLYASPDGLSGLRPDQAVALMAQAGLIEDRPLGQFRLIVGFTEGKLAPRAQVLEPELRFAMVLAGAGAAWLPAFLAQPEVARGALVDLSPGESRGPIDIHALYTAQASTSPKVRAFVQFLTQIMEPLALSNE